MLILLTTLALAGPKALPAEQADQLAKACGPEAHAVRSQSFQLHDEGKAWHGVAVVPVLGDTDVCLAVRDVKGVVTATRSPFASCLNCSPDEVAAIAFHDLNGDEVPDLQLAVDGSVGWNPQDPENRYVSGRLFYVWTASEAFELTSMALSEETLNGVTTISGLLVALAKKPEEPAAPTSP